VQGDRRSEIYPPEIKKLGDATNIEWAARFRGESLRASSWRRSPSTSLEWMLDV
jgi:hypothetical protein